MGDIVQTSRNDLQLIDSILHGIICDLKTDPNSICKQLLCRQPRSSAELDIDKMQLNSSLLRMRELHKP